MEAVETTLATARGREHRALHTGERPASGRLLVIDEHRLTALGIRLALVERGWVVETSHGPTALDVVDHAQRFGPDCVLMDVRLGDDLGSGIDLIGPLVAVGAQVVMVTGERRRTVLAECLEAGAAGWIGKDAGLDELDFSLGQLLAGRPLVGRTVRAALLDALRTERRRQHCAHATFEQLTERETLVLAALTDGLCAEEIAQDHFVSVTTIRSQIRSVLQKLGVHSQLAAVAVAGEHRELLPRRGDRQRDRRRIHRRDPVIGSELSEHIA